MPVTPSFSIPVRPERRYPFRGPVQYEGDTTFLLAPSPARSTEELTDRLEAVLEAGPYRFGDFYDLPMALFLVSDEETGDVFRVSVRDGRIRLHVLPETESAGLRALFARLEASGEETWDIECRSEAVE